MVSSNANLLERWAKMPAIVAHDGQSVPVVIDWEWGRGSVLVPQQSPGLFYYVYRRESVQGKFMVVKVRWNGVAFDVIGCEQTLRGALSVCGELNSLMGKWLYEKSAGRGGM